MLVMGSSRASSPLTRRSHWPSRASHPDQTPPSRMGAPPLRGVVPRALVVIRNRGIMHLLATPTREVVRVAHHRGPPRGPPGGPLRPKAPRLYVQSPRLSKRRNDSADQGFLGGDGGI